MDLFTGEEGDVYIRAVEELIRVAPLQIPGAYMLAAALTQHVKSNPDLAGGIGLRGVLLTIKIDNINQRYALEAKDKGENYDPEKVKRDAMERGKEAYRSRPEFK
ncbi:MAG: hypothetical protein V1647_06995, partial [Pseudomonadota bacterium]